MPEVMQQPETPDELARRAGRDLYETSVGILRRAELWRLGNAWGFNFPVGCTKDFMLPFFKQLEADGKNPLRPPGRNLDELVKAREVSHSAETHAEVEENPYGEVEVRVVEPRKHSFGDLEKELKKAHVGRVRKLCKSMGLSQTLRDRKQDLIARIIDKLEEDGLGQDIIAGG